jgi:hypothetical protein
MTWRIASVTSTITAVTTGTPKSMALFVDAVRPGKGQMPLSSQWQQPFERVGHGREKSDKRANKP